MDDEYKLKIWGWKKRNKGAAKIWTHPKSKGAIVKNFKGIFCCGEDFDDLISAAKFSMYEFEKEEI